MFEFLKDLWLYGKKHKKMWMLPIILSMMLVGALIIFTESSALSPFIYTLF
ncbi:DUF5989 family protein [Dasania sp. GY-MA-18]|uniref:DUF5989 family protein n=1 Tax=Dasania phycosphaerae TaxID=2950436 RepID=A0A9J6RJ60_9GAMM|nr:MULTISPECIES: DUF5989 family protein [Dasania]MCR8922306.1 DUF5989 family protein [Dasania sp. GY-MA-18]MCZ0864734.1 DUF5989 family protein [Dasania phycosphaerae]MCZ0868462.1 DUF5989 family protein [Dasania phycosphaerae]